MKKRQMKKLTDVLSYTPVSFSHENKKSIQIHWMNAVDCRPMERVVMNSLINHLLEHCDHNGYVAETIQEIAEACEASSSLTRNCIQKLVDAQFITKGYAMIRIVNLDDYKLCSNKKS